MKTFILFWNPAISSYKLDDFQRELEEMTEDYNNMNWSIWEHDKAHAGDRFFMVRCGNGKTGICMSGYFSSDPYKGEDWSGKGRVTYYMNLEPDTMIHPEYLPILTTNELINAIPSFDWVGGHSGRLLEEKNAEKLENLWKQFREQHKDMFIQRTFSQEVDPSDFIKSDDNTIYCWLNLTEDGEVSAYNFQYKINIKCKSIEKVQEEVMKALRKQIEEGAKVIIKFENINKGNQERFFSVCSRLLSLNIPPKYYRVINMRYDDEDLTAIVLYCLVKFGKEKLSSLFDEGFSSEVIDAVKALFPVEGETNEQHIKRIVQNEIATSIKIDMLENELDIINADQISVDDIPRLNNAIKTLKAISQLREKDKPIMIE